MWSLCSSAHLTCASSLPVSAPWPFPFPFLDFAPSPGRPRAGPAAALRAAARAARRSRNGGEAAGPATAARRSRPLPSGSGTVLQSVRSRELQIQQGRANNFKLLTPLERRNSQRLFCFKPSPRLICLLWVAFPKSFYHSD